MESKQDRVQNRIGADIIEFREQQQTLQLATITQEGLPHVSYTPFAFMEGSYYILVSDIAKHGQNIKFNSHVAIMLIEDETKAKNIYARKRLSFDTKAHLVERETSQWVNAIAALDKRFGEIVSNLSRLGDFNLYQLVPTQGRFVKGFGQAFEVSADDAVDTVHLKEGHKKIQ